MKQLLFLLLFPCLAMAQYQGNANQKITLGEQTTADGLVWRGSISDTANLLTNKLDTSVYIVLDTGTRAMWYYRVSTTPKWNRVVDSLNNLQGQLSLTTKVTGVLPVANGGTGQTTLAAAGINTGSGTQNYLPKYTATTTFGNSLIYDNGSSVGIGTASPTAFFQLQVTGVDSRFAMINSSGNTTNYSQMAFGNGVGTGQYAEFYRQNDIKRFHIFNDGGDLAFSTRYSGSAYIYDIYLNTSGNVGIGTTNPQSGYKLHVADSVYVGGRVSAAGYTTRSDYNLKDEIQTLNYGLNEVIQMQPVKYTYKSNGEQQLGFIAQDIGTLIPESVHFDEFMGVDYQSLIPILTKAIQEQQALIKALEQRILTLENK